MSRVRLFGYTIFKRSQEKEIQKLFDQYEKALFDQKLKMCNDITEWGNAFMENISKYVTKEKYLLEQAYTKRVVDLTKQCEQFIKELHVREEVNNTKQIDQLLDQCKALKYELVALKYHGKSLPFTEVTSEEPLVMDWDEFDNKTAIKDDNKIKKNISTYSIPYPNVTLKDNKQNDRESFTIKTSNEDDQSTMYRNDMLEECSTCFMTFPANISPDDRIAHVNGHFTNG